MFIWKYYIIWSQRVVVCGVLTYLYSAGTEYNLHNSHVICRCEKCRSVKKNKVQRFGRKNGVIKPSSNI